MNIIRRTKCAITGAEDIESLYTFKDFSIFMGCAGGGTPMKETSHLVIWTGESQGARA